MIRILDIAFKDILQLVRDRKIFMFLLVMPILFTFLFGYAFGGFGSGQGDTRLPVGYIDLDESWISRNLIELLERSEVLRLALFRPGEAGEMERQVADEKLAAAFVIPAGYGDSRLHGQIPRLELIGDTGLPAGMTIESELLGTVLRLDSALRTAILLEQSGGGAQPFDYTFERALEAWDQPPIRVENALSQARPASQDGVEQLAHTSPGMMLQFAIAGLLTSAQILVSERKSRSLQRLLTTATPRLYILLGHYLAILLMVGGQFVTLILFGQVVLKVDYLSSPLATMLVAFCAAMCIAALGLLIGTLAKTQEQAIIFSLVPMFLLAGLGGAWVPLEVAGPAFQVIGHISPIAWAMDGFKNITIRSQGLESVLLPAAALAGYALLFFGLGTWRFSRLD